MPLGARHDRVTGNAQFLSLLPLEVGFLLVLELGVDFLFSSADKNKLQGWPGRHVSWFSVQPALRSSAPNLTNIARVAQEEDVFSWLHSPIISVCLPFCYFDFATV